MQPSSWGLSEDSQASTVATPSAPNGCSEDGIISPNVSVLLGEKGYVDTRCYYFLSKSCFLDWWIGLIGPPFCCAQCPLKHERQNPTRKSQFPSQQHVNLISTFARHQLISRKKQSTWEQHSVMRQITAPEMITTLGQRTEIR